MNELDTEPRRGQTRPVGQGLDLTLAPWAFAIANSGDLLSTEHALDDTTPRGAVLIAAAHPLTDRRFTLIAMIGCTRQFRAAVGGKVGGSPPWLRLATS